MIVTAPAAYKTNADIKLELHDPLIRSEFNPKSVQVLYSIGGLISKVIGLLVAAHECSSRIKRNTGCFVSVRVLFYL